MIVAYQAKYQATVNSPLLVLQHTSVFLLKPWSSYSLLPHHWTLITHCPNHPMPRAGGPDQCPGQVALTLRQPIFIRRLPDRDSDFYYLSFNCQSLSLLQSWVLWSHKHQPELYTLASTLLSPTTHSESRHSSCCAPSNAQLPVY